MNITNKDFEEVLGYKCDQLFSCQYLALCNSILPETLTFLDQEQFSHELNENSNITVVITTRELAHKINPEKIVLISEDPRYDFYKLMGDTGKKNYKKWSSVISDTAQIHSTAYISENNVVIGERVVIEPNVTILADVEIGDDCIIRAGTVIGAEGFEQKKTSKGILPVYHDGKVIIGNNVHIGAVNAISKGYTYRHTVIGDDCKTDNLVHIAHCVQIGKRCLFPASCMIAGSVTIGDDVWVGPNASVSSGLTIDNNAYITIGAVVTRNLSDGAKVTGNFAIPHDKFLSNLKKSLKD